MIKKYTRLLSLALLILFTQITYSQDKNKDAFYRAIQKTGELHNFNGKLALKAHDMGYDIDYVHQTGQNLGISIKYMKANTKDQMDAFWVMAEAFGKMAKETYNNVPPTKKGKKLIEGITVETSDFPKCTLSNEMYSVETPRSRSMTFKPSSTEMIMVTGVSSSDPYPIMKTLIQQLKAEGLVGQVSGGQSFDITVTAEGYLKKSTYFHSGDFEPNLFVLQGQIINKEDDKPIEGAKIILATPQTTTLSDSNGNYKLQVKLPQGSKAFKVASDFKLEPIAKDLKIVLKTESKLQAPGDTPLEVSVLALDGKPIKGHVSLKIKKNTLAGFTVAKGKIDPKGLFKTFIKTSIPTDLQALINSPESLQVTIEATIFSEVYKKEYTKTLTIPLNLAIITGITTGPDMQPRKEKEPPIAGGISEKMRVSQTQDEKGNFYVLVHPLHPDSSLKIDKWELNWSDKNRLPLALPLEKAPEPGAIINLGKVDLLSPEEHINRLKEVLIAFAHAMPLTADEQSRLQKAIARIGIHYGSTNDVPLFKDHYFDDSGEIYIPGTKEAYWGDNLKPDADDAAYEILPHEIGHFIHHHIVERYALRNVCYNKKATGEHETWKLNPNIADAKRPYLSFSENTADFFAILFRNFWIKHKPEIKESRYFKRKGYLHEFETDKKAMDCIARGIAGYKQEGIQTRFLRVYYGAVVKDRSPEVMSDYLNTMLLYMDTKTYAKSNLTNRPARTISQWTYSKLMIPSAMGHADVLSLAARYRVNKLKPVPTASPIYKEKEVEFYVDGKLIDFGNFQVTSALYDFRLKLTKGSVGIDLSDFKTPRNLIMKAPCEISIKSRTEIEVFEGIVSVDFPADLMTPGGKVTPQGTVIQVVVSKSGNTLVNVLDGKAKIDTNSGEQSFLNVGESVNFEKTGSLGTKQSCNPDELYASMLPQVDFPEVDKAFINNKEEKSINPFSNYPRWVIFVFIFVALLLVVTFVYLLRYFIAALFIAPSIALFLLLLGRIVLKPDYVASLDYLTHLMFPWNAFQIHSDWISGVAWLVGSIIAGLLFKNGLKGFIAGLFFPIIPWFILHFFENGSMPNNVESFINEIILFITNAPENLAILMILTAIGGLIGGMMSSKRNKKGLPQRRKHARRKAAFQDYDEGIYDTDYDDDYVTESHDDDYDDGDDGDDE